tara:strand:- start:847 stop:1305 length:459 start_codon:yes stop_codon:yes gene_type:complete
MIRQAGIQDFDNIMDMMINFANSSPYEAHHNPQYNDKYVRNLLVSIIKSGIILIGEHKDKTVGMLIAGISPDPWLPEVQTLKEIAWWVEPDARNTTIGYKLLKKYIEYGVKMQSTGLINGFTLTNMTQSPDFDLEKRGWEKIEHNYLYRGAN